MIRLEEEFKKNGIFYKLIDRTDTHYFYICDYGLFYEIGVIRKQKATIRKIGDKIIEYQEKEKIPNNNQFGLMAGDICIRDEKKAFQMWENIKN